MDPLESIKQSTLPTLWKYLSYPSLIAFGKTSKKYNEILNNPETWVHLLKRDFNLPSDSDKAKDYYELLYLVMPNYKFIDLDHVPDKCLDCGIDWSAPGGLRKYEGRCYDCWYQFKFSGETVNNDVIILNKLFRMARQKTSDMHKFLISYKKRDQINHIAIAEGYNVDDIILKFLTGYELPQRSISLTNYIRDIIVKKRL